MKQETVIPWLKMLGATVPTAQLRGGWTVACCPLAHWTHDGGTDKNPAFAVRKENGDAFTHCFACGWHGSQSELVLEMRYRNKLDPHVDVKWGEALRLIEESEHEFGLQLDSPDIEEMLFGDKAKRHVFPDWWLETFPPASEVPWALDYLASRQVTPKLADALDIRADAGEHRVCFPVRDFAGRLRGLHGRAVHADTEPRYRMYRQAKKNNPLIWLGESWVDVEKPIIVVEGPLDLASVYRVYRNVVSPLFANPSEAKLSRMADAMEWVTLLDRGKGGDSGRAKIEKLLKKDHVIQHLQPPVGRKDPGEMTLQELTQLIAKYVKTDELLLD